VNGASRTKHREYLREWRNDHPGFYRQWSTEFKAWRDAERAKQNNVRGNSRARVKGKLAYEVNVTNKLPEEERVHHD
jgi:hypothetical protein